MSAIFDGITPLTKYSTPYHATYSDSHDTVFNAIFASLTTRNVIDKLTRFAVHTRPNSRICFGLQIVVDGLLI